MQDQAEGIKRSEGIRRIVRVLSVCFVLSWMILFIIITESFKDGLSSLNGLGWTIFIVAIPITYLIPQVIIRVSYWIIDGFRKDRET